MNTRRIWINLAVAAALGVIAGWWLWNRPSYKAPAETIARLRAPADTSVLANGGSGAGISPGTATSADEANNIPIYNPASPAVVNITSTVIQYDFFFNAVPSQGTGSGFLIDDKGDLLTNYHVI